MAKKKQDNEENNRNFWINTGIAGGVSGCVAKTIIAPLDRIKILFQTSNPHYLEYSKMRFGFLHAGKNIWKNEGIFGLFKGHSVTLIRVFPYAAIKFLSYEKYRNLLIPNINCDTGLRRFASGSLAGLTSVLFTYPLDIIRVRLAFEIRSREHTSFKRICRSIFKGSDCSVINIDPVQKSFKYYFNTSMGFFNFYRGFTPTLIGMLPYSGVSFWAHDFIVDFFRSKTFQKHTVIAHDTSNMSSKEIYSLENTLDLHQGYRYKRTPLKAWAELTAGGLAGLFSQTVAYPLEVIRRKMQVSDINDIHKKKGIYATALEIWNRSGYRGFFVGLTISYVKAIPMISSSFFIYERLMHYLIS
ncbi:hypothetical protein PNEG_02926 [Pneumocystis murina B123]|uniref:Mitochondrial carrier protein LEU5 n=1 Tax=Pneumocystis murina (strain B123) TaxID=1069680 RepID=M7PE73_PNEMU|nr:hypothetical protein PNEG_02926 [Pneumocystis murina B123]EMR08753.1 hypothetical protein PNEG_02926 [Pneumocystis murina B123]